MNSNNTVLSCNALIYSDLTAPQIWLIICGIVVVLLMLAFILYLVINSSIRKKRFKEAYGKSIYQIAMDNDYYLVNTFGFSVDSNTDVLIDHILFGDRYIFCIADVRYQGVVEGKENDQIWFFYPNGIRKKKQPIGNPLTENKKKIEKLSLLTGADRTFFISLVVFNNDCYIDDIQTTSRDEYIRNVKELSRLIKAIESRPIENMDPKALEKAVQDIAKLKEKFENRK